LQAAPIGRRLFIGFYEVSQHYQSLSYAPVRLNYSRRCCVYSRRMSNPSNPAIAHLYPGRATGFVTRVTPGKQNFVPKFPRPAKRRQARSTLRQGFIAVLALVTCVTLGVLGTDQFLTHRDVALADEAAGKGDIYRGSILFYPDTGNTCHQLFFNNQDGQFADNGRVDCTRAVAELSKDRPKNPSAARTEVIGKGFH
jgi:hypothetical protein